MAKGFLQIPRSLLEHPTIESLNDKHFRIFIKLLQKMCYRPCKQDDHGVTIDLEPGQFMFTFRDLAKELKVSVGALQRILARLTSVQISTHKTIHTKTILTFTFPDICALLKKSTDTESDTKSIQDRYTKAKSNNLTSSSIRSKATEKKQIALPPVSYETKEDVKRFLALGLESGFAFAEKSVIIWLKKHKIDYMISHFYDMVARKNLPNNFHTWFTTALKNNYVGEKDRVEYHRKWISDVKDIYNLNWIKINKTDCRFTHDLFKETLKFDLVNFKAIVLAKVNALKEKVA